MRKRLPNPFFPNNSTFGVLSCKRKEKSERASYSYCAHSWRQQTNPSRKKNFSSGWKCSRLDCSSVLENVLLLRIFRALQTSRVLCISMNARWRMNQLLNFKFLTFCIILPHITISSPLPPKNGKKSETSTKIGSIEHHLSSVKTQGL